MIEKHKSLNDVIIWSALFLMNFVFIALTFILPTNSASHDLELARIVFFSGLMMLAISFAIPRLLKNTETKNTQVISLAFNEQASVMAFLISYIFGDNQTAYILFGLSIVGFLLKFPKNNNNISKLNSL
ncbi:MAG: hypothetical protein HOP07_10190 [Bacteriovoracaceae bacterium]|nr:hypothetical protein [Bacteriovoracaceae bacterium]